LTKESESLWTLRKPQQERKESRRGENQVVKGNIGKKKERSSEGVVDAVGTRPKLYSSELGEYTGTRRETWLSRHDRHLQKRKTRTDLPSSKIGKTVDRRVSDQIKLPVREKDARVPLHLT